MDTSVNAANQGVSVGADIAFDADPKFFVCLVRFESSAVPTTLPTSYDVYPFDSRHDGRYYTVKDCVTIDVLPRTPGNNVYVGFMVWSNFTATKCRGLVSLNQVIFFFSSRRRHTRWTGDWSSDVCSSDLAYRPLRDGTPAWFRIRLGPLEDAVVLRHLERVVPDPKPRGGPVAKRAVGVRRAPARDPPLPPDVARPRADREHVRVPALAGVGEAMPEVARQLERAHVDEVVPPPVEPGEQAPEVRDRARPLGPRHQVRVPEKRPPEPALGEAAVGDVREIRGPAVDPTEPGGRRPADSVDQRADPGGGRVVEHQDLVGEAAKRREAGLDPLFVPADADERADTLRPVGRARDETDERRQGPEGPHPAREPAAQQRAPFSSSTIRRTTTVRSNSASARTRAARPSARRRSGSPTRARTASVKAARSPWRTRSPVPPSTTAVGVPPARIATIGRPLDIASSTLMGRPSARRLGSRNTSAAAKTGGRSSWARAPRNLTRSPGAVRRSQASIGAAAGPSPATTAARPG